MTLAQEGDSDDHFCIGGQKPDYSVLYSSGRSHSNFLIYNFVVLKSYGDLIYFELGRIFRLEILIGWGEAETENDFSYLFVCFVFVCLFLPQEPEKCSVLSAFS